MGTLRVAVVLPMYNEAGNVEPLLERLDRVRSGWQGELWALAVDDGSQDETAARLREAAARHVWLGTLGHPRNRGMAAAVRTGIAAALARRDPPLDALAFMDADLTHDPADLPALLRPLAEGTADFVLGSRYVPGGGMRGVPFARRAVSVLGNAVVRRLLRVPVRDMTSGYRAARGEVFRAVRLEEDGFGIQLEGTVKAHRAGFRIAEVPITLGVRKNGYSKMAYTRAFWLGYARLIVRLALMSETRLVQRQPTSSV